ncbi:SpoIIE family protein phosphatase [Streptomyces sp. NPDC048639]|uniref:SpoIIE family protein phosphatase n=1 Tax=Streptomyces sp. NPDC048639 TaxID=3365581 RepID=UPI00371D51FE
MASHPILQPPHIAPQTMRLAEPGTDLREELPAALELNGMGSFLWDLDTDKFLLDAGAMAVFDFAPGEYDDRTDTLSQHMVPEEVEGLKELVADAIASRDNYGAYFRVICKNGTIRWTHTQGHIQRDVSGRPLRIVGIVRDASPELEHLTQQASLEKDRERQTDVVHATTSVLSQALTIEDVVDALTSDELLDSIGAVSIALYLVENDRLRIVGSCGMAPELIENTSVTRLDTPLPPNHVVCTQTPLFIDREETERRFPMLVPYCKSKDCTAAAVLPLIAQAQTIGAIAIVYEGRSEFSPEERNLLLALGGTTAQSFQRAVLYDEEHAMAVGLQQAMLPANIPEVTGASIAVRYRPARNGHQIGGDWYDVVPLPTGRVGLVVGDVQGHDIHASAVMGQLRIALRAYAAEGHPPSTVMARASAFLHDLDTDRFATCIYADFDPVTGRTQFVRAGHHGPLVRHADGRCARPYVHGGLPLGLPQYSSNTPYPPTSLQLGPDETLLLCTDGLVEFHGMDIDEGVHQIESILCGGPDDKDELAEHIVATIESRQGQEDDVALLLVGLTGARHPEERRHWSCLVTHSDPSAPAQARQMLRSTLTHWGLEPMCDAAVTAANELIANAVMHTEGDAMLTARLLRLNGDCSQEHLKIEVQDSSSTLPHRRTPSETSSGSRGLLIVEQLSQEWGAEPLGAGKRIWFKLSV